MTNNQNEERRHFVLIGRHENWQVSLSNNLWGFTENSKGFWNKTNTGDLLAFYIMSPLRKVVGFGTVGKKFINEDLIWNDEKQFKRSLWKYKFEINPSYICEDWKRGIALPSMSLGVSRKLVDKETFVNMVKNADKTWNSGLFKEFFPK